MGMVIGIDVGGSTTKIIGVDKEGIKHPMIVKAEDPTTSLFGAFGKYIYDNGISLNDIDKVMLTGVGSAYVNQPLYGLSTDHTDEFLANGLGAHYDSQLQDLIVVSMGTGTSFVKVEGGKNISHPSPWTASGCHRFHIWQSKFKRLYGRCSSGNHSYGITINRTICHISSTE